MRFPRTLRLLLMPALDLSGGALAAWLAFYLRFEGQVVPQRFLDRYVLATALGAVVWVTAGRWAGLWTGGGFRSGRSVLEPAFEAALVTGGVLFVVNTAFLSGDLSRAWIGLLVLGLILFAVLSRRALRVARRALAPFGIAHERYALVGDDFAARRLLADLTRARGAPFSVVACLGPGLSAAEMVLQARAHRLDGFILPSGQDPEGMAQLASALSGTGVDVLVAPALGELELRVASVATFHGVPLLRVAGLVPRRPAVRTAPRDRARRGVAILGTRGIPANYGGFETFAERLALGLVGHGVDVTVYGRSHYATVAGTWRGVRLVALPTVRSKHLDTVIHTALSVLHLIVHRGPRDVVLCNAANAPMLLLLRLFRRRVVLNVDGLEWRRSKWGIAGRSWYRLGEWLSVRLAAVLVTDAHEVRAYYRVRHDTDSLMIPYGADPLARGELPPPTDLDLRPDHYALYASRWERENNPLLVVQAHASADTDLDLVMLGEATYDEQLGKQVRTAAGERTRLPGARFGADYRALQANAACYIHATEVGGTHPALVEALAAGNLCLVLDTPENREVAGDAAWYFHDQDSLAALLRRVADVTPRRRADLGRRARAQVAQTYSWPAVTLAYLEAIGAPTST